jgi:hypothetical protein
MVCATEHSAPSRISDFESRQMTTLRRSRVRNLRPTMALKIPDDASSPPRNSAKAGRCFFQDEAKVAPQN